MTELSFIARMDAFDRDWFTRLAVADESASRLRGWHRVFTHLGGTWITVLSCLIPIFLASLAPIREAAYDALIILVVSHAIVQLVKRTVGRPRPSSVGCARSWIADPDKFSFPSGHSAAAMSVALAYAYAFPVLSIPLLFIAFAVGMSRVCLGVHYPGDVLMGQLIALLTGVIVLAM